MAARTWRPGRLWRAGILASAAALALMPLPASAQVLISDQPLSKGTDLKLIERLLDMSPSQRESAQMLVDHAKEVIRKIREGQLDTIEDFWDDMHGENFRDPEIGKKYDELREAITVSLRRIEREQADDLKSLLTTKQLEAWPMVERTVRRRWNTGQPPDTGEPQWSSLDLIAIVNALKLADDQRAAIQPTLDTYERTLDEAIVAEDAARAMYSAHGVTARFAYRSKAFDQARELWRPMDAAEQRIAAINRAAAHDVETKLAGDSARAFHARVTSVVFPLLEPLENRRPPALQLAAADRLDDLDDAQHGALAAARDKYQRERAEANRRAEAETERLYADEETRFKLNWGDTPDACHELWKACNAERRDIEARAKTAIERALRPEQFDKLPGLEPPEPVVKKDE